MILSMGDLRIVFRIHTIQRMFERRISDDDVKLVIQNGEIIEEYEDAIPYPGRLILGWRGNRPLHIVLADNEDDKEIIGITVYEPDSEHWRSDFRSRKK
jgi:hypothetical protein